MYGRIHAHGAARGSVKRDCGGSESHQRARDRRRIESMLPIFGHSFCADMDTVQQ